MFSVDKVNLIMKFRSLKMALCLMAAALLMASCQDKEKYASIIPEDAFYTVRIDQKALVQKAGIDQTDPLVALAKVLAPQMKEVLENPMESGIDVMKPMYLSIMSKGNDFQVLMVAKGKDADKLKRLIKRYDDVMPEISEMGGKFLISGSNMAMIWDDDVVAFMAGDDALNSLHQVLNEKPEKSIVDSKDWQNLKKNKADITFYMNMANMPETMKQLVEQAQQENPLQSAMELDGTLEMLRDNRVGMTLNFEDGQIVMKSYQTNSPYEPIKMANIDRKFLKQLPGESVGFLGMNCDMSAALDQMFELMPSYRKVFEESLKDLPFDMLALLRDINGHVVFNCSKIDSKVENVALQILAETKGDMIYKTIEEAIMDELDDENESVTITDHKISVVDDDMSMAMGQDGNIFYMTINSPYPCGTGLEDAEWAKDAAKSPVYLYFDFKAMAPFASDYAALLEPFDYMEMTTESDKVGRFSIHMTDKKENALRSIYQLVLNNMN